ncbi:MAG: trehalose-phosphatase [Pseudomonadota bacterium]
MTPPPLLPSNAALFLDFDGTLAPLQADPDAVRLDAPTSAIIEAMSLRLSGALILLSGRDIRDLSRRTPANVWRAGGHGLEVCRPGETPMSQPEPAPGVLQSALTTFAERHDGVRLEVKGPVLAVHYRQAPEKADMVFQAVGDAVDNTPGYKAQSGKMVVEAKPETANKGIALQRQMAESSFKGRIPVMVGDDTTDEDAFAAAAALGGWAVKVGDDGDTLARHRLASTQSVALWLENSLSSQDRA